MRVNSVAVLLISLVASMPDNLGAQATSAQIDTVLIRGVPSSFQIASVPIPTALRSCGIVTYGVRASEAVRVISPPTGSVSGTKGTLLVTMSIAGSAPTGRTAAATVFFTGACAAPGEAHIVADVARVRSIRIVSVNARSGALPGERLDLRYSLTNLGNAPDSVDLLLAVPPGWQVHGSRQTMRIDRGQSIERVLSVGVPSGLDGGSAVITLTAIAGADTLGSGSASVTVIGARARARDAGPNLTVGAAGGRTPDGTFAPAYRLRADGRLTEDIRINGEIPLGPSSSRADQALIGVGYWRSRARLTLDAPAWHLGLGQTGTRFPDITGSTLFGRGVTMELRQRQWRVSTIAAQPTSGLGTIAGELAGAMADTRIADILLGVSVAHLAERGPRERQLDAASAKVAVSLPDASTLTAELGHRRFAGGGGVAWATEYQRRSTTGSILVRAVNAQGGTAAYARAAEEYSLYAYQDIRSRLAIGTSAWLTRDSSASWRRLSSEGVSLNPSLRVGRGISLGIDGFHSRYQGQGGAGSIDNRESRLTGLFDYRRGFMHAIASASAKTLSREVATQSGLLSDVSVPRAEYRGTLSADSPLGWAQAYGSVERGQPLGGLPARYLTYGARIDRIPLIPGSRRVLLSAWMGFSKLGDRPTLQTLRVGSTALLPRTTRLRFSAERNPYVGLLNDRKGWMVAMALERDFGLPRVPPRASGTVYRDMNANGRRDSAEEGVQGVIMSNAGMTALTDQKGRYRFRRRPRGPVKIDAASVPTPLVVPPTTVADSSRRDIGLIAVGAVTVRLVVAEPDRERVDSNDLSAVTVIAHDSLGRSWVSRPVRAGEVALEGLPSGRYSLTVDATAAREPLLVDGTSPTLTVIGGRDTPVLVVNLRARALRIREFPKTP